MEIIPQISPKPQKGNPKSDNLPKTDSRTNCKSSVEQDTKIENEKKKITCHYCQKEGHKVATCRFKKREQKVRQYKQEKQKLKSEVNFKKFIVEQFRTITKRVENDEDIAAQISHTITKDVSSMLKDNFHQILNEFEKLISPFQKFIHNNEKDEEKPAFFVHHEDHDQAPSKTPNKAHEVCPSHHKPASQASRNPKPTTSQENLTLSQAVRPKEPANHHEPATPTLNSDANTEGDGGGGDEVVSCRSPSSSSPDVKPIPVQHKQHQQQAPDMKPILAPKHQQRQVEENQQPQRPEQQKKKPAPSQVPKLAQNRQEPTPRPLGAQQIHQPELAPRQQHPVQHSMDAPNQLQSQPSSQITSPASKVARQHQQPIQHHPEIYIEGDDRGGDEVVSCRSPSSSSPKVKPIPAQRQKQQEPKVMPIPAQRQKQQEPKKQARQQKLAQKQQKLAPQLKQSKHHQDPNLNYYEKAYLKYEERDDEQVEDEDETLYQEIDPQHYQSEAQTCSYCQTSGHERDFCEIRIIHLEEKLAKLEEQKDEDQIEEYETKECQLYQNKKKDEKQVIGIKTERSIIYVNPKISRFDHETPMKLHSKKQFRKRYLLIGPCSILVLKKLSESLNFTK